MKRKRRVLLIVVVLVACAVICWLGAELWVVREEIFNQPVRIGEDIATVKVERTRDRIWFQVKEVGEIGGNRRSYTTEVRFPSGRMLKMRTDDQPRALWLLEGQLYLISRDVGQWHIGRWNGTELQAIRRSELPVGGKAFNLVPEEYQTYYAKEFDLWAK